VGAERVLERRASPGSTVCGIGINPDYKCYNLLAQIFAYVGLEHTLLQVREARTCCLPVRLALPLLWAGGVAGL
jgi:hypothetical protein